MTDKWIEAGKMACLSKSRQCIKPKDEANEADWYVFNTNQDQSMDPKSKTQFYMWSHQSTFVGDK